MWSSPSLAKSSRSARKARWRRANGSAVLLGGVAARDRGDPVEDRKERTQRADVRRGAARRSRRRRGRASHSLSSSTMPSNPLYETDSCGMAASAEHDAVALLRAEARDEALDELRLAHARGAVHVDDRRPALRDLRRARRASTRELGLAPDERGGTRSAQLAVRMRCRVLGAKRIEDRRGPRASCGIGMKERGGELRERAADAAERAAACPCRRGCESRRPAPLPPNGRRPASAS